MIRRIVKLTFKKEEINNFKKIFKERKELIANSEGCFSVELLQDKNNPNVFFTFSLWEKESHLNQYRNSELFKETWKKTKALFLEKPMAWSTESIAKSINENGI